MLHSTYYRTTKQSLFAALRVPEPERMPAAMLCRVLYAPSFHPEAMVEVEKTDHDCLRLTFTTMQTNWHYWQQGGLSPHWTPRDAESLTIPSWKRVVETVQPAATALFLSQLLETIPPVVPSNSIMIDGMPTLLWFRAASGETEYREFNGDGENPFAAEVTKSVLDLARETLTDIISQNLLADIDRYM
ncbi:MAG: hypothetical protein H7Y38_18340 [Armatimonadetes bacterium]|nr:hypothetical protein [Armatimonadota bacterium]